ncbi:nucleotidyltransferase domain-containing protein [Lysinibacillus sp. NPDC093692]|uniref:nucleotidyltransferase domain-containing protein n=1 Tax=Lysinibacillus sp. NPDC093692 TaxID=3390578 RepID=UPI003D050D10
MEEWRIALEEFLKDWKNRNDVVGALVCGSYVTGNPTNRSDIDVHIILSDDVDWREGINLLMVFL